MSQAKNLKITFKKSGFIHLLKIFRLKVRSFKIYKLYFPMSIQHYYFAKKSNSLYLYLSFILRNPMATVKSLQFIDYSRISSKMKVSSTVMLFKEGMSMM